MTTNSGIPPFLRTAETGMVGRTGVPLVRRRLQAWKGAAPRRTYNHKPLVVLNGKPSFAEIWVLDRMRRSGWTAAWYTAGRFATSYWGGWNAIISPARVRALVFGTDKDTRKRAAGCWDVVAWKGSVILFIECKRKGKDALRKSQVKFIQRVLAEVRRPSPRFVVLEWDL